MTPEHTAHAATHPPGGKGRFFPDTLPPEGRSLPSLVLQTHDAPTDVFGPAKGSSNGETCQLSDKDAP